MILFKVQVTRETWGSVKWKIKIDAVRLVILTQLPPEVNAYGENLRWLLMRLKDYMWNYGDKHILNFQRLP